MNGLTDEVGKEGWVNSDSAPRSIKLCHLFVILPCLSLSYFPVERINQ